MHKASGVEAEVDIIVVSYWLSSQYKVQSSRREQSKKKWGLEKYIVQGTRRDSSRSSLVCSSAFRASSSARSLEVAPAAARSKASL